MERTKLYLSTIASDASEMAREYGLGLELAEYCTAINMDLNFNKTHNEVKKKLDGISSRTFHGPFNELFPCAIDPKAAELAVCRYRQAIALAKSYGCSKMVLHGGFNPMIYYPQWYVEKSVRFWNEFLREAPGIPIALENVMEQAPCLLSEIFKEVAHPDFSMCLDVGHVNAFSSVSVMQWLEDCAPYISHFHIHNNDGRWDQHMSLQEGCIPMKAFLLKARDLCPKATFTLEVMEAEPSLVWLREQELI